MKNFIEEFKAFAMKGNVVDLAIAVVIGTAFGKIVSSLVDNIIMPVVGALVKGADFSTLSGEFLGTEVKYGLFIQSTVDFLIVALVLFLVIKVMSKLKKAEEVKEEVPKGPTEEVVLLREIRDSLRK